MKAMAATAANTMLATLKRPVVLNNFDFNFLYNILFSPYLDFKDEHILWFGTAKYIRESTHIRRVQYSLKKQEICRCEEGVVQRSNLLEKWEIASPIRARNDML